MSILSDYNDAASRYYAATAQELSHTINNSADAARQQAVAATDALFRQIELQNQIHNQTANQFANQVLNQVGYYNTPQYTTPTPVVQQPIGAPAFSSYAEIQAYQASHPTTIQQQQYAGSAQELSRVGVSPTNVQVNVNLGDAIARVVQAIESAPSRQYTTPTQSYDSSAQALFNQVQNQIMGIATTYDGFVSSAESRVTNSINTLLAHIDNQNDGSSQEISHVLDTVNQEIAHQIDNSHQEINHVISDNQNSLQELSRNYTQNIQDILASFNQNDSAHEAQRLHEDNLSHQDIFNELEHRKDSVGSIFENAFKNGLIDGLGETIHNLGPLDFITGGGLERLNDAFQKLLNGEFSTYDDFTTYLFGTDKENDILYMLMQVVSLVPIIMSMFWGNSEPILERMKQTRQAEAPVNLLGQSDYAVANIKGIISEDEYFSRVLELGIDRDNAEVFLSSIRKQLDENSIFNLLWRSEISESEATDKLYSLGYSPDTARNLLKLSKTIPGPSDITRMADKHIFATDVNKSFGQYSEMDGAYIDAMYNFGFSKEWTEKYWGAHWSLPSPNQLFEMLQRKKITEHEMDVALKLTDYMPFFRDKLKEIAYAPYTRVDIRRMFKLKILDYDEMVIAYEDIGYEHEKALRLAEYTVASQTDDDDKYLSSVRTRGINLLEKDFQHGTIDRNTFVSSMENFGLSAVVTEEIADIIQREIDLELNHAAKKDIKNSVTTYVLNGLKRGVLPESEARNLLTQLGYDGQVIDSYVQMTEIDRLVAIKSKIAQNTIKLYATHYFNETEFNDSLANLGFNASERNILLNEAVSERELKNKKVDEKHLAKWFEQGLLSEQQYYEELLGVGYLPKYASTIVHSHMLELSKS